MKEIRIAKKEDAALVALLGRITFTQAFGSLFKDPLDLKGYLDTTFSVAKIENSILKQNNVFWIALVAGLPVGYAKLKLDSPSEFVQANRVSQLQKIYVLQEFLSMKIGRDLQDVLLEKAKASGSEHIWLSVYEGNTRAIAFYLKHGFNEVGKHHFAIGKQNFGFMAMSKQL